MKISIAFGAFLTILFGFTGVYAQQNVGPLMLDPGFATGGKSEVSFEGQQDTLTCFVSYKGAARTIAAGKIATGSASEVHLGIVSYDTGGNFTSGFGTNGRADLSWTGYDYPEQIVLLNDGSILAAGSSHTQVGYMVPAMFRIKADGTPDSSFGMVGRLALPQSAPPSGNGSLTQVDTALNGDGSLKSVTVLGTSTDAGQTGIYACRLTGSLTLDPTFGTQGKAWVAVRMNSASGAMLADGSILFAIADTQDKIELLRLRANGLLDSSFGENGILATNITVNPELLEAMPQFGNLFLVLTTLDPSAFPFTLIRFNLDGSIDTTFGAHGFASDSATLQMTASAFNFSNNESILVCGSAPEPKPGGGLQATAVATKFLPTGVLDPTFGSLGVAIVDPDSGQRPNEAIGFSPIGHDPTGQSQLGRYMVFGNPFFTARFVSVPQSGVAATAKAGEEGIEVVPDPVVSGSTSARVIIGGEYPDVRLEIYDAASRLIETEYPGEFSSSPSLPVSLPAAPGIYQIRVTSRGNVIGNAKVAVVR